MKKKLFSTIAFLIILAFLLGSAYKILYFKDEEGILSLKHMYKQPDNRIDVLFLGSSHCFMSVNTKTLYDEYGIAGYILGGPNQPIWNSYYYLSEALRTQKPGMVLLECFSAARVSDQMEYSMLVKNNVAIRNPLNRIASIFTSMPPGQVDDFLFDYRLYHTRYYTVTRRDFPAEQARARHRYFTGMITSFLYTPLDPPEPNSPDNIIPIREKEEIYIRKIVELCHQNDIPVMLFLAPFVYKPGEIRPLNYVRQLAAELGVDYIDYNSEENYARIGMDFRTDMMNEGHLNWYGSIKFTHVLAEDILTAVDLPDRRGDREYEYWERSSEYFFEQENNRKFKEASNIEELLGIIHDSSNLLTFLYASKPSKRPGDEDELLSGLGISDYVPEDGDLFRIDKDGAKLVSGSGLHWSYSEDIHDHTLYAEYGLTNAEGNVFPTKSLIFDGKEYLDNHEGIYILVYNTYTRTLECANKISFDENGNAAFKKL